MASHAIIKKNNVNMHIQRNKC